MQNGQYSWRIDLGIFFQTAANIVAFPDFDLLPLFKGTPLFIMGGVSIYTDKDAIYSCFPTAEIFVLEGANHWLHVDNPDAFYTKVKSFLQKKVNKTLLLPIAISNPKNSL